MHSLQGWLGKTKFLSSIIKCSCGRQLLELRVKVTHEPILSIGCEASSLRFLQCGMIIKYNKFILFKLQTIAENTR